jgi:hypothetical protein
VHQLNESIGFDDIYVACVLDAPDSYGLPLDGMNVINLYSVTEKSMRPDFYPAL